MFVASLRTTAAIALVFALLAATFFLLGIGDAGDARGHDERRRLDLARDRDRRVVRFVRRRHERDVRPHHATGQGHCAVRRRPTEEPTHDRPMQEADPRAGSSRELLEQERFDPPEAFVRDALITDLVRARARGAGPRRPGGVSRRSALHWFQAPATGARRRRPALRHVVRGRDAQRLLQLPGPPRRGRPRRPRGLPLARRGGRGAGRHLRRAARATSSASPTR